VSDTLDLTNLDQMLADQEAVCNQLFGMVAATDVFQRWQQAIGALNLLKALKQAQTLPPAANENSKHEVVLEGKYP